MRELGASNARAKASNSVISGSSSHKRCSERHSRTKPPTDSLLFNDGDRFDNGNLHIVAWGTWDSHFFSIFD
jgi:hypothetical protein